MLPEIKKDFEKYMKGRVGGGRLQNALRASSIGFACDRYHYYSLTETKKSHNWELQSIFDEGNLHEKAIEKTLREMGYDINDKQKEFRLEDPLITMHIDGTLTNNFKNWYPFDSKSINPWDFQKLDSAEDFLYSKKPHQRNYATQILLYMDANNAEYGCLVLKDKQTGLLKDIWFSFEQHVSLIDEAIKRAQRVYKAKENKTPPERTEDRSLCSNCDFKDVCIPDLIANGGIGFLDSADLAYKLDKREELKASADQYAELDDEIKAVVKQTGVGEKVCGAYSLQVKEVTTTRKVPITYDEEQTTYLTVKINKI